MVRPEGAYRTDEGGRRSKKGAVWLGVIAALVLLAVLFFFLFDVDGRLRGDFDVDVPSADIDVDAPDIDIEGGDVDLPDVDVDPENEADGTNPGGDTPTGG